MILDNHSNHELSACKHRQMTACLPACLPNSLPDGLVKSHHRLSGPPTFCFRVDTAEAGLLKQLFAKYAVPAIDYVLEGLDAGELVQKLKLTIQVTNLNLITQLCHLLDSLLLESGHYTDPNVGLPCPTLSLLRLHSHLAAAAQHSCKTSESND